jgi:hypothetical protein
LALIWQENKINQYILLLLYLYTGDLLSPVSQVRDCRGRLSSVAEDGRQSSGLGFSVHFFHQLVGDFLLMMEKLFKKI